MKDDKLICNALLIVSHHRGICVIKVKPVTDQTRGHKKSRTGHVFCSKRQKIRFIGLIRPHCLVNPVTCLVNPASCSVNPAKCLDNLVTWFDGPNKCLTGHIVFYILFIHLNFKLVVFIACMNSLIIVWKYI